MHIFMYITGCMMKYRRWLVVIYILITALIFCSCNKNSDYVEPVLKELSQASWNGRQVGTDGNIKAGEYLANLLKNLGYETFIEESYYHTYSQYITDSEALPTFKIIYESGNIEELEPGIDFIINRGGSSFSIKGELSKAWDEGEKTEIILSSESIKSQDIPQSCKLLLVKNDNFRVASNAYRLNLPYNMIDISPEVYNKLSEAENVQIEAEYQPNNKNGTASNIIGVLKGKSSEKALVLSAHFDGVASFGKLAMTCAYDNATGTAALMEVARQLAERAKKRPFALDIIVCFFNGEEAALEGSKAFTQILNTKYEKDKVYNINIDCVGGKNCGPLAMKPFDEMSNLLYEAMTKHLQEWNIPIKKDGLYPSSDHANLASNGIPVLVIGQNDVFNLAHRASDKIENINISEIKNICDALVDFIVKNDGNTFYNSNAGTDLSPAEWDEIRQKAELLTKDMELDFNELFVFEFKNQLFCKSGYRPLRSEEELKKYYPDAQLPDFSNVNILKDYTIDTIDISNDNYEFVNYYWGKETGKVELDLKMDKTRNARLIYSSGNKAVEINMHPSPMVVIDPEYSEKELTGDYEGYRIFIGDYDGKPEGFGYYDNAKKQYFYVYFYTREPITVDGNTGYRITTAFLDEEQVYEFIDSFDFKNKGESYFRAIYGR